MGDPGESATAAARWMVECGGESVAIPRDRPLVLGRAGDFAIDSNPHLHRRLVEIAAGDDTAWVRNVGSRIPITVADEGGLVRAVLAPGGRVAVPCLGSRVTFSAGSTRYELRITRGADGAVPEPRRVTLPADLEDTIIGPPLTAAQRLLIVALAEPMLREGEGPHVVPTTAAAAARLGWTIRAFTRRLDQVCRKLARTGAAGVASAGGRPAIHRRLRLVEYAVQTRLVTRDDLALLPPRALPRR